MTDFTPVCAPTDGLQAALTQARGRRLRAAGWTTSTSAFALLAVALLALPQGNQVLLQEPEPQQPAIQQQDRTTRPTPRTPDLAASTGELPGSGPGTGGNGSTGGRTATGARPILPGAPGAGTTTQDGTGTISGPSRTVAKPVSTRPYRSGAMTSTNNGLYFPACEVEDDGGTSTSPLCTSTNTSTTQGSPDLTLYADICSNAASTQPLTFSTNQEVDFAVLRAGKAVWRWSSTQQQRAQPHQRVIQTGGCWAWETTWTGVDDAGRRLPAGDYTLVTSFAADEVQESPVRTTTFTL